MLLWALCVVLCCCSSLRSWPLVVAAEPTTEAVTDLSVRTLKQLLATQEATRGGVAWSTFIATHRARGAGSAPSAHFTSPTTPSAATTQRPVTASRRSVPHITGAEELLRLVRTKENSKARSAATTQVADADWNSEESEQGTSSLGVCASVSLSSSLSSACSNCFTSHDSTDDGSGSFQCSSSRSTSSSGSQPQGEKPPATGTTALQRRAGRYVVVGLRETGTPSGKQGEVNRNDIERDRSDSNQPDELTSHTSPRALMREELTAVLNDLLGPLAEREAAAPPPETPEVATHKSSLNAASVGRSVRPSAVTRASGGPSSSSSSSSSAEPSEDMENDDEEHSDSTDSGSSSDGGSGSYTPEVYFIDAEHMLVYVPTLAASSSLTATQHEALSNGKWTVYDLFLSSTGQLLKLAPSLRELAAVNDSAACRAHLAAALTRRAASACASTAACGGASAGQDESAYEKAGFPSSPLHISVSVARGEAANVVGDLTTSDRLIDIELAADIAAGVSPASTAPSSSVSLVTKDTEAVHTRPTSRSPEASGLSGTNGSLSLLSPGESSWLSSYRSTLSLASSAPAESDEVTPDTLLPNQCKAFFTIVDGNVVHVDLYFKDDEDDENPTAGPCECLKALSAIAAHPSVRWIEPSATSAEALNYKAVATLQSGYDADVLLYETDATMTEAEQEEERQVREAVAHPVWTLGINGSGEIVSISDSGLDLDSCFFADPTQPVAIYPDINHDHRKVISFYACGTGGMSTVTGGGAGNAAVTAASSSGIYLTPPVFSSVSTAGDKASGHGTHVAGSAVGSPVTSEPAADVSKTSAANTGVAPGAKLFFRVLGCATSSDSDGAKSNTQGTAAPKVEDLPLPRDITEIFKPAYEARARISSNSWGLPVAGPGVVYTAIERQVDQFAFTHDDMLILFAAGNRPQEGLYSPGTAKNVLTVGAHLNSLQPNQQDRVADFSAYGPTYDQRRKPEVLAPGGKSVLSANASGLAQTPQCTTAKKAGTSMATALLAGGAALVRQFARERLGLLSPSSALLKALLVHSTARLQGVNYNMAGYGRVDLSAVTGEVVAQQPTTNPSSSLSEIRTIRTKYQDNAVWVQDRLRIGDLETQTFCFTAGAASYAGSSVNMTSPTTGPADGQGNATKVESTALKVTLAWNDPATAVEGSSQSLVHDLDLVVVDADGKLYYSHPTDPTKVFFDRNNNVEQVRIPVITPALAKLFRVIVYGNYVQQNASGQLYSLVVSAPGLVVKEDCMAAFQELRTPVYCPGNCSGSSKGFCESRTAACTCVTGYRFADCSLCDEVALCHGHGSCDSATLTCTCAPGSRFRDAHCSICEEGWYGPLCDSRCQCENNGVCDKVSGLCTCPQNFNYGGSGCYQGAQCQYCCEGFAGADCNERSYWCDESDNAVVSVDDADGGYIQVNGYGRYPYSATCRWNITALPYHRIQLEYVKYEIEDPYDALFLFDFARNVSSSRPGSSTSAGATMGNGVDAYLVRKDTGLLLEQDAFTVDSTSRSLFLLFQSDWAEVREGFLIRYLFVPVSRCERPCLSPFPQVSPSALTCGESIGFLEWCVCARPYVGWYCNITGLSMNDQTTSTGVVAAAVGNPVSRSLPTIAGAVAREENSPATVATDASSCHDGDSTGESSTCSSSEAGGEDDGSGNTSTSFVPVRTAGPAREKGRTFALWGREEVKMELVSPRDALRPRNSNFVSESTVTLSELPASPLPQHTEVDLQSIARVPLVINGYTLLTVQSLFNTTASTLSAARSRRMLSSSEEEKEWVVNLVIVPFSGTESWMTELPGLKLGVAYVNKLRPDLRSSNFSAMQLIDLYTCPDSPSPSFKAPLRVPWNMRAPGGTSQVQLEAQLILTLRWDPTQEVPVNMRSHTLLDTAVIAMSANYTAAELQAGPGSGSSVNKLTRSGITVSDQSAVGEDLDLQCADDSLRVAVGAGVRMTEPAVVVERAVHESKITAVYFILIVSAAFGAGVVVGFVSLRRQQWRIRNGASNSSGSSDRLMVVGSGSHGTITTTTTTSGSTNSVVSSGNSARHSDEDGDDAMLNENLVNFGEPTAGYLMRSTSRRTSRVVSRSRQGIRSVFRAFGRGSTATAHAAVSSVSPHVSPAPVAAVTQQGLVTPTSSSNEGDGASGGGLRSPAPQSSRSYLQILSTAFTRRVGGAPTVSPSLSDEDTAISRNHPRSLRPFFPTAYGGSRGRQREDGGRHDEIEMTQSRAQPHGRNGERAGGDDEAFPYVRPMSTRRVWDAAADVSLFASFAADETKKAT